MRKNFKDFLIKSKLSSSITNNFRWLMLFAAIAILLLSVGFNFIVYNSYVKEKTDQLPKEASQIDLIFTDSIQYVENYANFIGQRIAESNGKDFNYIAGLLGGIANTSPNSQNLFINTLFDWVTPDKKMVVTSNQGVLAKPIDMSHREYLDRTLKHPWTLQLQDPALGIPSNQWIIPGGVGITNEEGEYLGSVTLGFAIDGLAKKINSILGKNELHFVILTKDFKYVGGTNGGTPTDDKFFFARSFDSKTDDFTSNAGFLSQKITYGNDVYSYYQRTSKYGYIILTGYNTDLPSEIFDKVLLPRLIEFAILGTVIILLLFMIKKSMVEPLVQLSNVADKISRNEKIDHLPRSNIREIRTLSEQLVKVKRSILREKKHKEQIAHAHNQAEEAVAIAREAKAAKEEFLKKLRSELKMPLTTILGYAEMMVSQQAGPLSPQYQDIAQNIYKIGYQVGTLMTNVLNCKVINTSKVLQQCISIYKDKAYFNRVNYTSSIDNDLPFIYVDEVRFRQIIVGIIYHSLVLTPAEENIHISAVTTTKDNKPLELIITIKDTGFGCSESFRRASIDKMGPQGLSRNTDGTDLTLDAIRNLLALHYGTLKIEATRNKGTLFIITIPYLEERPSAPETPPTPDFSNVTPLFRDKK